MLAVLGRIRAEPEYRERTAHATSSPAVLPGNGSGHGFHVVERVVMLPHVDVCSKTRRMI
jgi:hypothetical protein